MRLNAMPIGLRRLTLLGLLAVAAACAPDSPGAEDARADAPVSETLASAPEAVPEALPAATVSIPAAVAVVPEDVQAVALVAQHPGSSLTFTGTQAEAPFTGQFKRFQATVLIDDTDMRRSFISAQIETGSADTRNAERDETLLGPAFFDVRKWPLATFRSSSVSVVPAGFVARGPLTIRDQTHPVAVNFGYSPATAQEPARLQGTVSISRLLFNVGAGEWADTEAIGDTVRVKIELILR